MSSSSLPRILSVCAAFLLASWALHGNAQQVGFNQHIRPLLAEYCLECHGPDEDQRQAGLRLDIAVEGTSAIVPLQSEASELVERVTTSDPDRRMPPPSFGKTLNQDQVDQLRRWIDSGAEYESHWSLMPIQLPAVPDIDGNSDQVKSDIDRFIIAQLQQHGLSLSPAVSREQLIRRATFDLIGLPPTWREVQEFVNDPADDAYAKVIDRLLESPRYGERWGRHWLDLARYADTHGGSAIGFTKFPFSYVYRDYVIAAFNNDLPYDQFVVQQLAADQIDLSPNDPALAALGFLTVGRRYRSPHDVIDDQIDVVARGLMGLTVTCARCHDHKFDPIPTTDYYSLYATFASSEQPQILPIVGEPAQTEAYQRYQAELAKRQRIYDDMARDQSEILRGRLRMQVGKYLRRLAEGVGEQDLTQAVFSYRTDDLRPHVLNRWRRYVNEMPKDDPVFGVWVQLRDAEQAEFETKRDQWVEQAKRDNGDPAKFAAQHQLGTAAPKWNPRIVDAIEQHKPVSLIELSDVYGGVFAEVQREWLQALLDASLEADIEGEIVPDQDARHAAVNGSIHQQLRHHLYGRDTPTDLPDTLAAKLLNRTVRDNLNGKAGSIHNLNLQSPGSPPRAMVLEEKDQPEPSHVLRRGNPIDRGQQVSAQFLSAIPDASETTFVDGRRRFGLAEALIDDANPLTRRVIVNWVWQHHFGKGLVRTPDDFGTRGRPPTHPKLLDFLASTFANDGWSLKQLHRRIMLSAVYQQSAVESEASRLVDPDNQWLWRMPRRRLDLESMRDAMLSVSGELDTGQVGGRPFDFLANPVVPRRSVYALINRDIISPLASTFDSANPSSCTAKRPHTTVPQQTLFALNSQFIQDRAVAFSKQSQAAGETDARVRWMYRSAYGRNPDSDELATAIAFVTPSEAAADLGDRWSQLAHVLLASNEFVFLD